MDPAQGRRRCQGGGAAACFRKGTADPPFVAVGDPRAGVEGFRRSHMQAQDARAIACIGANALALLLCLIRAWR